MPTDPSNRFQSVLSAFMEKFLQEKHACGYAYHEPTRILRRLDDFLVQEGLATHELPGSVARKWLAKKAHESAGTQQQRITVVRHFSRFLLRLGYSAYVPDSTLAARNPIDFCAQNADRRRASKVLSGRGRARAYGAFAFAASHYAGSFSAPVWMRVSCRRSAETTGSRRRSESRHHHGSPRKVPQRSVGSSRLAPRKPLAKVRCPF